VGVEETTPKFALEIYLLVGIFDAKSEFLQAMDGKF
jgi:hypothetical protein